jgi:phosphoenolpyruvate-protein kinase (PTS system EI component)
MLARKGRAAYLGERSVGHQDPGATSSAMLLGTAAGTLAGPSPDLSVGSPRCFPRLLQRSGYGMTGIVAACHSRALADAAVALAMEMVGVMMEVPSAALKAGALAPYVDFFSIGTNDLTQYTMVAERGNAAVAGLADPLDPGVLALIDLVCRAACGGAAGAGGAGGRLVAVCGELAADPAAAALLVAMGVPELSVAPPAVPDVKEWVRAAAPRDDNLVKRCLAAASAGVVRAILRTDG